MSAPRVLLVGPQWFGDLLSFCERGLQEAGAQVRVLPLNDAAWLPQATRLKAQLNRVPTLGPLVNRRYWARVRRGLAQEFSARLSQTMSEWQPQMLLFIACWGYEIAPELLASLPSSVPKIGWLMDDPFLDDGSLARSLTAFDRLYVVDESWARPVRLMVKVPVELLACGGDLHSHHPVDGAQLRAEERGGIVFVGSSYAGKAPGLVRRALLEEVSDLDLRIYGDEGWARYPKLRAAYQGRGLKSEEANRVYNGADMVLNIHHPQFRAGTSLRTFALCASGACQLVDYRPGLERFFVLNQEIVVYDSPQSLRAQAERLMMDAPRRRQIARAGYERVKAEHTYAHRGRRILDDAGL